MILVTGGTGLLGSYLCRYLLAQGKQVRALRRKQSSLRLVQDIRDRITWVDGDVLDLFSLEDAMQGVDEVYHCAGLVSYLARDATRLMQVNAAGTENTVNAALVTGVRKFLHVSSIAAIGRISGQTVTENMPWEMNRATSVYAHSKYAAERAVWRGIAEGLRAVIINPSLILGAGDWESGSSRLFSVVDRGFKFYTRGTTGYVDVRDVARVAHLLMGSPLENERFIVNSENLAYRDFLWMVADALGRPRPSVPAGKFLSALTWRGLALASLFSGKAPAVTRASARIANSSFYFDNRKIREALHYDFIPIHETIREVAEKYLEEKRSGAFHPLAFA